MEKDYKTEPINKHKIYKMSISIFGIAEVTNKIASVDKYAK